MEYDTYWENHSKFMLILKPSQQFLGSLKSKKSLSLKNSQLLSASDFSPSPSPSPFLEKGLSKTNSPSPPVLEGLSKTQ